MTLTFPTAFYRVAFNKVLSQWQQKGRQLFWRSAYIYIIFAAIIIYIHCSCNTLRVRYTPVFCTHEEGFIIFNLFRRFKHQSFQVQQHSRTNDKKLKDLLSQWELGKCIPNFICIQASLCTLYTRSYPFDPHSHAHSAEWTVGLLNQARRNKYPYNPKYVRYTGNRSRDNLLSKRSTI